MEDKDSRTEEPTSRKLSQSHQKGQFAKSEELNTVAMLTAFFLVLLFLINDKTLEVSKFTRFVFENMGTSRINYETASDWMTKGLYGLLYFLAPFLIIAVLAVIISAGYQSGFKLTPKVIEPNLNKLNPISGFKKIFSLKSLVQSGVDFLKVVAVIMIIWGSVAQVMKDPIFTAAVPAHHIVDFILESTILMFIRVIIAMAIIAVIHYMYQKWQTHQDLKMTKQEVKDERRQQEGDPQMKGAQRKAALRNAQRQMLSGVPTADVVVTNPTHFAVALRYERGKDLAPIVVAKGENLFARRIKDIANQHEVPIVEDKVLARVLFRLGKVGEPIPAELYQVVADTLAYVYRNYRYYFYKLKARRAAQS